MRKLLCVLLTTMLIFVVCGCGSQKSKLENYVTNYDEVVTLIQKQFGSDKVTITDWKPDKEHRDAGWQNIIDKDMKSIEQFGNGKWYLLVNDINVDVNIQDHIATSIVYNNGTSVVIVNTPTYEQIRQQQIKTFDVVDYSNSETITGFDGYHPDAPVETVGTTADIPVVDGQ